jgi:hypothetical protein
VQFRALARLKAGVTAGFGSGLFPQKITREGMEKKC